MKAHVSIADLFNQSLYRRQSSAEVIDSARDRRELFAVAAVALAIKHQPKFGQHFLSKLSGMPEDGNLEGVVVELQPRPHADLVVKDPARGRLFVVEFKFHSLLKEKQNPLNDAFVAPPNGYGYQITQEPSYTEFPKKYYVVIQKAKEFDQKDSLGIVCRSLAWHDLDVKPESMGELVDDLLDSLGEMGIPSFRFRHLNSMKRAEFTAEAVDMHQVCEAIAAELQIKKKNFDWEIGRDGMTTWYGMHLPLGLKTLQTLEQLTGNVEGPWGWYGYIIEERAKPQLAIFIYPGSSDSTPKTLEYMKERLPEQLGYSFRPVADKEIVVTADAEEILDEKDWFTQAFDRLKV